MTKMSGSLSAALDREFQAAKTPEDRAELLDDLVTSLYNRIKPYPLGAAGPVSQDERRGIGEVADAARGHLDNAQRGDFD